MIEEENKVYNKITIPTRLYKIDVSGLKVNPFEKSNKERKINSIVLFIKKKLIELVKKTLYIRKNIDD